MNYTSAAIGLIAAISLITWLTTGRQNFTGPRVNVESMRATTGQQENTGIEGSAAGSGSGVEVVETVEEKVKERF